MSEAPLQIHYNGSCPVCSTEIRHYRGLAGEAPIEWCDIMREPTSLAHFGIDQETAKKRFYLVRDGALLGGIEAFLVLWARLPYYRNLARIVGSAPVKPVAVAFYDHVLAPALYRYNKLRGR